MAKNDRLLIIDDNSLRDESFSHVVELFRDHSSLFPRNWWLVEIRIRDLSSLQGIAALASLIGSATRLRIEVSHSVELSFLHLPIQSIDGRTLLESSYSRSKELTQLFFRLGWHARFSSILGSCIGYGLRSFHSNGVRIGIDTRLSASIAGSTALASYVPQDRVKSDRDNPGPNPVSDILLSPEGKSDSSLVGSSLAHDVIEISNTGSYSTLGYHIKDREKVYYHLQFDERIYSPIALNTVINTEVVYVSATDGGGLKFINLEGREIGRSLTGELPVRLIDTLRGARRIIDTSAAHVNGMNRLRFLVQAAASGLSVCADLDFELRAILKDLDLSVPFLNADDHRFEDDEWREFYVISLVRWAHTNFTMLSERRQFGRSPSLSVLMATKRPDFVSHALDQFEHQSYLNKELLLGLHGFEIDDLSKDIRLRLNSSRVSVTSFPENVIFGDLLRSLTNHASGEIVSKMDDDDWYGPDHLLDLVLALQYSGAELVGSGVQYTYLHNANMTVKRRYDNSYKYGGHPGGPTFTLRREALLSAGNWPRVSRAVDTGLNDAIIRHGGSVFQSHSINFLFNKRSSGHTWNATSEYFLEKCGIKWLGFVPPLGIRHEGAVGILPVGSTASRLGSIKLSENFDTQRRRSDKDIRRI